MALTLVNNKYVGPLVGGLGSIVTIGASDLELFQVETTVGSKMRFTFISVTGDIRVFTSICAVTDSGSRSVEYVDVDLVSFVDQQVACNDEAFRSEDANAGGGYLSQQPNLEKMARWASMLVKAFAFGIQNTRWSGDTASSVTLLAQHDGVVKLIQQKNAYDESSNPKGYQKVTTTAVTVANVFEEINKVYGALEAFGLYITNHIGAKIVVSPKIAALIRQRVKNNNNSTGFTALPTFTPRGTTEITGQLTTGDYFGAPVYVAYGLNATTANRDVIICGIFEDTEEGVLKYAVTMVGEDSNIEITDLRPQKRETRLTIVHSQNIAVSPDCSQIAMNI